MIDQDRPAQAAIAPFAGLFTIYLWAITWIEILSRGAHQSPDDFSKLYLAFVAAYEGAAEFSKWTVDAPTDATQDPRLERIQRGGALIGFWLIPLLFVSTWRMADPKIPMPGPLPKIAMGLVGVFFIKFASRRLRHKEHGVINPVTGEVSGGAQDDFANVVYQRIRAAPQGMAIGELFAAFSQDSKPRLYRSLDKLVKVG